MAEKNFWNDDRKHYTKLHYSQTLKGAIAIISLIVTASEYNTINFNFFYSLS